LREKNGMMPDKEVRDDYEEFCELVRDYAENQLDPDRDIKHDWTLQCYQSFEHFKELFPTRERRRWIIERTRKINCGLEAAMEEMKPVFEAILEEEERRLYNLDNDWLNDPKPF